MGDNLVHKNALQVTKLFSPEMLDFQYSAFPKIKATFQHTYLPDTPSQNEAVKSVKDSLSTIHFDNQTFESPIAYAFMYIQWEANEVKELIPLEK